jgi:hypothetical protein
VVSSAMSKPTVSTVAAPSSVISAARPSMIKPIPAQKVSCCLGSVSAEMCCY